MYKDISYAQKRLKQVMEIVAKKEMHKKQVQHVVLILVVNQVHIVVEKMLSSSESTGRLIQINDGISKTNQYEKLIMKISHP
jgi:hypothetical protein